MTTPWKKGRTYYARIPNQRGAAVARALGTRTAPVTSPTVAGAIRKMLDAMVTQGDWRALNAMADGRLAPVVVLEAWKRKQVAPMLERLDDVDLVPLIPAWLRWCEARRRPNADGRAKYERQVRRLLGASFPRSQFKKATLNKLLTGLADAGVGQPNRYRAALSSFGRYLSATDVIERNVVLDTLAAAEAPPRVRWLERAEAWALLDAITDPLARSAHAVMAATGLETQAVLKLRHRDVRDGELDARGTKRLHRTRTVAITEPEPWARVVLGRGTPDAPLFPGLTAGRLARALRAACRARQVEDFTPHDWRHCYAVWSLRDGQPLHHVAHQLGHATTVLTQTVYGRFVPAAAEIRRAALRTATERATERAEGGR